MAIEVHISSQNMNVDERLEDYVTKKVSKLDHYLDVLEGAHVDLRFAQSARNANDRQIAQITVQGRGVVLRAEERSADMYVSLDSALDKIERQIDRYKGRHWNKRGDGRTAADAAPDVPLEAEEVSVLEKEEVMIERRKRFALWPMDELEAVEQMSLLDHQDFFVFLNAATNEINVLYRRRNGSLGILETEMG